MLLPVKLTASVPESGNLVFRQRTLGDRSCFKAEVVRIGGEGASDGRTRAATALAILRRLTLSAPASLDLGMVDFDDGKAMAKVFAAFGSLSVLEMLFEQEVAGMASAMGLEMSGAIGRLTLDRLHFIVTEGMRPLGRLVETKQRQARAMALNSLKGTVVSAPVGWNWDTVDLDDERSALMVLSMCGQILASDATLDQESGPDLSAPGLKSARQVKEAFLQRYRLTATHPRYLALTEADVLVASWAHAYADDPQLREAARDRLAAH